MKKSVFKYLVTVLVLCCYAHAMQDYSTALGNHSKVAEISQAGELSFYFAGYNDVAKPEHGKILVSVILRKWTVVKKTDKNGKSYNDKELDDQVIGSGTLKEGFNIRIKDPKSDQYEVIVKVKDDRLLKGLVSDVTGTTKVGDANVRELTINLQKTMYITAHEIIASKSANNRNVITYSFAVKAASAANANVPDKGKEAANIVDEASVEPAKENAARPSGSEIDYFKENLSLAYEKAVFFQNVKTDWAKLGLRGLVKSVQETDQNNKRFKVSFNQSGQIIVMELPTRDTKTFTYTSGRLTKITERKADGKLQETVLRYNDKGQITTEEPSFDYASNGTVVYVGYNTNGPVLWKGCILVFDEITGLLVRETPEDANGIESLYENNENGRFVKKTALVWENEMESVRREYTCTYTYNAQNDIATKTCTCREDYSIAESTVCPPENVKYSYTYDAHGNWTVCSDGRKRTIEYYDGGNQDCIGCDKPEQPKDGTDTKGGSGDGGIVPTPPTPIPPTTSTPGQQNIIGIFEYKQYGGVATLTFHADGSVIFINMFKTVESTLAYESQKAKDPTTGKAVFSLGFKNSDGSWRDITNTFLYDGVDEIVLSTGEIYRRKQTNQPQNSKAAEILKTTKCTEARGWFDGALTVRLEQQAISKINTIRISDDNLHQNIQEVNVVDGHCIVTLPVPTEKQLQSWKDTKLLYLQASSLTAVPADLRLTEFSLNSFVRADNRTYSISVQNLIVTFLYADRDASIYGRLPGGGGYRTYDICLKKGWNTIIYRTGTMEDTTKTEPLPANVVWIIR